MIIRSQDKKAIFNFENSKGIKAGSLFISWSGEGCDIFIDGEVIGKYSTEEKAIKVLDMICEFADEKHYEKIVTEQCGCICGVVFNMPQDSEV